MITYLHLPEFFRRDRAQVSEHVWHLFRGKGERELRPVHLLREGFHVVSHDEHGDGPGTHDLFKITGYQVGSTTQDQWTTEAYCVSTPRKIEAIGFWDGLSAA